jgi:DGQHR domain-containing protein
MRDNSDLGTVKLPSSRARALDGQHRLLALHQLAEVQPDGLQVPAVVFDSLTPDQVVELFVTINSKHTKLNPSHLISLSGRRLYRDDNLAAAHDVIRGLNEDEHSPLFGQIKVLGVGKGTVTQASLAGTAADVFSAMAAAGPRTSRRSSGECEALLPSTTSRRSKRFSPEGVRREEVFDPDGDGPFGRFCASPLM